MVSRSGFPSRSVKRQRSESPRAGGRQRAERPVADDGLGVDRLAGAVDPALGEDGAGGGGALLAPRVVDPELVRGKVGVVVVDPHQGAVGAQARGHVALEGPAAPLPALLTVRSRPGRGTRAEAGERGDPPLVRAGGGAQAPPVVVQLHLHPGARAAVAHAGHPHDALVHPDPRVHRQVGDLDQGQGGPFLAAEVHPAAGDPDGEQRPVRTAGRVGGREAHPGDGAAVLRVAHGDAPPRGAGGEALRPGLVPPAPAAAQEAGLQRVGDRREGDLQRVHVDVLHRQRAEALALHDHPPVREDDRARDAGGGEAADDRRPQPLPEDVAQRRVHRDGVAPPGEEPPLQHPALGLLGGVADRERAARRQPHPPLHVGAAHGGGEHHHRRAVVAAAALGAPGAEHPEGAVGGEGPAVQLPRHAVQPRGEEELGGAPGREGADGRELGHAAQVARGVVPRRAEVAEPLRVVGPDGALAEGPERDGAPSAAPGAQGEAGGGGQLVRRGGAAQEDAEHGLGAQEARPPVGPGGMAGEDARALHPEGEDEGAREAGAVHGREGVGDGDPVRGAGTERGGRGEAQRHRVAPLGLPLHRGLDAEERGRVHRLVEPARHRAVEGDHDGGVRVREAPGLRRRAQNAQDSLPGVQRVGGAEREEAGDAEDREERGEGPRHGEAGREGVTRRSRRGSR